MLRFAASTQDEPVQDVQEGAITEEAPEEVAENPKEVYEDPVEKPPVQEVSEVEEAEPEFEQATIEPAQDEKVKKDFQADVGNDVPEEQPAETNKEALAAVEEKLEEAEQEHEEILAGARKPSNKKAFKAGMYKFKEDCTMYKEPATLSGEAGKIRAGKKLWIDGHDDNWRKAYKKAGAVYIPANCLE